MSVDYIAWIEDALQRKPHLNQSGLARHMGRHRSVISAMMNGHRQLKANEIAQISAYLGEAPPETRAPSAVRMAPIAGRISTAWYERGAAPVADGQPVPAAAGPWQGVAQSAYIVDAAFPAMGVPAGAVVLCVPVDRGRTPQPGQVVVCRRERAGLENLTLARMGEEGDATPIAIGIEVRISLP